MNIQFSTYTSTFELFTYARRKKHVTKLRGSVLLQDNGQVEVVLSTEAMRDLTAAIGEFLKSKEVQK